MIIIATNTSIVGSIQSEIYGNTYFSIVQKGEIFVDVFVRYQIHVVNLMNLSDILNSKDTSALSKSVMIILKTGEKNQTKWLKLSMRMTKMDENY